MQRSSKGPRGPRGRRVPREQGVQEAEGFQETKGSKRHSGSKGPRGPRGRGVLTDQGVQEAEGFQGTEMVQQRVPPIRRDWGILSKDGDTHPVRLDEGTPSSGWIGVPLPPGDRAAQWVLATRLTFSLLCSRKTFCCLKLQNNKNIVLKDA